jgi:hypothetical protein
MPVEIMGVADRKTQGQLQTESPIEKFGMKSHYSIGDGERSVQRSTTLMSS